MAFASVPELIDEIRAGRMVVIVDDEDRKNEGDLIMAAELVKPSDINFMVTHGRGLVCLTLTRERCRQLALLPMVQSNTSPYHTNFTVSIEAAEGVTTGISAYDRAHTIRTAVRPDAKATDLVQPGHIFPLTAQPGGVLNRAGHTEAGTDLAMLAGLEPASVLVEILNDDGSMARRPELEKFAQLHGLKMGSIESLIRYRLETEQTVERIAERDIETDHGPFKLFVYRDVLSHALHFALLHGQPDKHSASLVRVQSLNPLIDSLHWRCPSVGALTGDVLARLKQENVGALILLNAQHSPESLLATIQQADASTDPAPNAKAAALQEWRRTGVGSQILADLGFGKLRVLGIPRKQIGLAGFGLEIVEHVELYPR